MFSVSRRVEAARKAFEKGDVATAAALHDPAHVAESMHRDMAAGTWFEQIVEENLFYDLVSFMKQIGVGS